MKQLRIPKQNKRTIVASLLEGRETIAHVTLVMRVQVTTIQRWLDIFGRDQLASFSHGQRDEVSNE